MEQIARNYARYLYCVFVLGEYMHFMLCIRTCIWGVRVFDSCTTVYPNTSMEHINGFIV